MRIIFWCYVKTYHLVKKKTCLNVEISFNLTVLLRKARVFRETIRYAQESIHPHHLAEFYLTLTPPPSNLQPCFHPRGNNRNHDWESRGGPNPLAIVMEIPPIPYHSLATPTFVFNPKRYHLTLVF